MLVLTPYFGLPLFGGLPMPGPQISASHAQFGSSLCSASHAGETQAGGAMPAAPRALGTRWQQEPDTGWGNPAGYQYTSCCWAVILHTGLALGTWCWHGLDSSSLWGAQNDVCSLQASKLEKQSSMSESDYDNPTTPLEMEETG